MAKGSGVRFYARCILMSVPKVFIGIDNGVTGSIGVIGGDYSIYIQTPIRNVLNYTKKKAFLNRVDGVRLANFFKIHCKARDPFCFIERPMVNPGRWNATISGVRAMEATLIVLESLKIPYQFVDSKEWQRALLPSGLEKEELKHASRDVGIRLFPTVDWKKWHDADGLLIAEYCRRIRG